MLTERVKGSAVPDDKTPFERIRAKLENTRVGAALLIIVLVLAAVGTFTSDIMTVVKILHPHKGASTSTASTTTTFAPTVGDTFTPAPWPQSDYSKLKSLALGVDADYAGTPFGRPIRTTLVNASEDSGVLTERDYVGHGFWLTIASGSDGLVDQWRVTSCDAAFDPSLQAFTAQSDNRVVSVPLWRSVVSDVGRGDTAVYNVPADNPPTYEEQLAGSHAEGMFTIGWGADSSCGNPVFPDGPLGFTTCEKKPGYCGDDGGSLPQSTVDRFRSSLHVNAWEMCTTTCLEFDGYVGASDLSLDARTRVGD